ncbi:MAG: RecQ family ATP-dependent DNA helicase [Bacteroidaceae bacterium]|nr:RecQ family ATP-dependent DNA helicase [Bacteroidaceae bacterium]
MLKYREILKQYWGYDDFRGIQREIIESIEAGRDTLGLMPTGGGKSIAFQVPTLAREGLCIVVTPLIALMKDQVANLRSRSIKAAAVYSGMRTSEVIKVLENCIFGDYKFLYVSPERLSSEIFLNKVRKMPVSLITVDEAHCISQWGHDFRPAYRRIAQLRTLFPDVPVLALTATATLSVVHDIQQQLGFERENCFRMSFERKNLVYVVRRTENKFQELLHILGNIDGSTIIYVPNRKKCKELCEQLIAHEITAEYYHAGLAPESKDEKEERWRTGVSRVIVATNAFGMGIDKPDVRLVVHTDLPNSIEAYFQEAGRAGRDGQRAYAVVLYSRRDNATVSRRLSDNYPLPEFIREVYDNLCYYYTMALGDGLNCTFEFALADFCHKYHLPVLPTDSALRILTRMGYIDYVEEMEYSSRLCFIVGRDDLYRIYNLSDELDRLITALLRNYSGLFSDFVFIDERYLARLLGVTRHHLYELLVSLSKKRIIQYAPSKKCPIVTFTRQRVLGEELRFAPEVYDKRREAFSVRLDAMLKYATSDDECRSRYLLRYFNDAEAPDCGHCDVCLSRRGGEPSEETLAADASMLLSLLADGRMHSTAEIEALGLPRARQAALLRRLCDEERIVVVDGGVRIHK